MYMVITCSMCGIYRTKYILQTRMYMVITCSMCGIYRTKYILQTSLNVYGDHMQHVWDV